MKRISLISNSSIQYHKFDSEINLDFSKSNKLYFHQPFDTNIMDFTLDPLFKIVVDDTEKFYRKQELIDRDYIINNKIKDDVDLNQCQEIVDYYDSNFKSLGLIKYEITKIIRKLKKDDKIIELEKILSPLSRELTNEENENIKVAILGYINEALRSDKLKKLLIVTHPHLKHLSGVKYTNQMHNSVLAAYQDLDQNQKMVLQVWL